MSKKSDADLALSDKLDLARTLIRYKARRLAAHELNEVEDAITKRHNAEVASGTVVSIDIEKIGMGHLAKELPSGDDTGESASGDADNNAA